MLASTLILSSASAVDKKVEAERAIPYPSKGQIIWHEQERLMFVCLDPCTWQGREYDNHTTKLEDMKLPELDTDQWCEAAKAWDAKAKLRFSDAILYQQN